MPTDRLVAPQHVLKAVMELERRGPTKVLSELEQLEPDLVEYLLEGLTRLHHRLTGLGVSGTEARKVYRQAEKTALVCLLALHQAHRDLWRDDPIDAPDTDGPPIEPPDDQRPETPP